MWFLTFLRSGSGRVFRVVFGAALFWAGIVEGSMTGLLLMMIGLVPIVTGIANVCLIDDVAMAIMVFADRRRHPIGHKP